MLHCKLAFCVLAGLLALPLGAVAQGSDEAVCANRGFPLPPDKVMAACDRLVADTHQRDSARARAFVLRGNANLQARRSDAAFNDFTQAAALDGENFAAYFWRGQIQMQKKEYAGALADFTIAQKLEPGNGTVHLLRSIVYLGMKRYGEAIAEADLSGDGINFVYQRCRARAEAGTELEKARTACNQALWADPSNANFCETRGVVGLKQKRFQDAWDDFNTVLKAQPRNARALYGRGLAATGLNRDADAKADLAQARMLRDDIVTDFREIGLPPG